MTMKSPSLAKLLDEIDTLVRACYPVISLVTSEEVRVEQMLPDVRGRVFSCSRIFTFISKLLWWHAG